MSAPTQNQLDHFWNGMQETLKKAGADLSLRSPEDLFRFRMAAVSNPDIGEYTADVTCSFPFSTNPDLDPATAAEEELIRAMKPGKPDNAALTAMFNAAREGRLFFNSLIESSMSHRQLVTDKDGNTSVLPDANHSTPEILMVCHTPVRPKKPKYLSVGFRTALAAFFGSEEAKARKREIQKENAEMRESYEQSCREWQQVKHMNPDFRRQVANGMYATVNYFQIPMDDESFSRESRLADIAAKAHKRAAFNGLKDMIALSVTQNAEDIADLVRTEKGMTPEIERHLAQIFYMKSLEDYMNRQFDRNQLTEKDMTRCSEQITNGTEAYRKRFEVVCGAQYRRALAKVTLEDIRFFAENPEAAAIALYTKAAAGINEAPAQKPGIRLEKAEVKQAAKNAPELSHPGLKL